MVSLALEGVVRALILESLYVIVLLIISALHFDRVRRTIYIVSGAKWAIKVTCEQTRKHQSACLTSFSQSTMYFNLWTAAQSLRRSLFTKSLWTTVILMRTVWPMLFIFLRWFRYIFPLLFLSLKEFWNNISCLGNIEEQIGHLEKLVPDWIHKQVTTSGDVLYKSVFILFAFIMSLLVLLKDSIFAWRNLSNSGMLMLLYFGNFTFIKTSTSEKLNLGSRHTPTHTDTQKILDAFQLWMFTNRMLVILLSCGFNLPCLIFHVCLSPIIPPFWAKFSILVVLSLTNKILDC